ncbi:MAG: hypothetical protein PVI86_02525, partial [Phycisphaerae bacterium]
MTGIVSGWTERAARRVRGRRRSCGDSAWSSARRITLALAALVTTSGALEAQPMEVLCLGTGRGYTDGDYFEIVMPGDSMDTVRTALNADGFTFVPAETFTADALEGYRIVFLGLFDPAESLSLAERNAVEAYVRGGGTLIYLGDNSEFTKPNLSVAGVFDVGYGSNTAVQVAKDIADPTHSIVEGAAGTVVEYDGSGNLPGYFGGIRDLGRHAYAVVDTDEQTLVAVIDRDALEPGSGAVVLLGDANGFLDPDVGTVGLGDNVTLMRNIFQFAAGECSSDAECDDGVYCNGVETCPNGICAEGSFPCSGGLGCIESSDSCGPCTRDSQCDDMLYCNGKEMCTEGVCEPGPDACDGPCGQCDEDSDSCEWCSFDLDRNGVIGTGDFGFFSSCMGGCYSPGHQCEVANFDGDLSGCVGSGDFAGFSGCFGLACADCSNCFGDSDRSKDTGLLVRDMTAAVRLIASVNPTASDGAELLPAGQTAFRVGQRFFVEVWASREGPLPTGLAAAYVDVTYDATTFAVDRVDASPLFAGFVQSKVLEQIGVIRSVGGSATPGDQRVGIDTAWVRVATIEVRALRGGVSPVGTRSAGSPFGISIVGELGNLEAEQIDFG